MRHLAKHLMGHDDEDHLISAIWNLVCLYHLEHKEPKMIPVFKADPKDFKVDEFDKPTGGLLAEINHKALLQMHDAMDGMGSAQYEELHTCDECGELSPTLFKTSDGKKVCYKCWHKSEDDLK